MQASTRDEIFTYPIYDDNIEEAADAYHVDLHNSGS